MLPIWEVLLLTSSGSLVFPELAAVKHWFTLAARPAEILLSLKDELLTRGVTPCMTPPLRNSDRRALLARDLARP